ncbi:MAG: response regulator transcription factor [Snowella sp.]|nr:response regulator transcription factor [Snowella sp.]
MTKIRIALIEDEEIICIGLRQSLSAFPEITWLGEAQTAQQGFQLLQTQQPDVAIIDIGLPDESGIALTKRLKASPDHQNIKVLILTFHHGEQSVLAAFGAGADSYCMKDTRPDLLLEAIKATQADQNWIDPAIARLVLAHTRSQAQPVEFPQSDGAGNKAPAVTTLTDRELEVLKLIVNGHSNAEIAEKLFITIGTVKTHVRNILNKLGTEDRTQAAVQAIRSGLVG